MIDDNNQEYIVTRLMELEGEVDFIIDYLSQIKDAINKLRSPYKI